MTRVRESSEHGIKPTEFLESKKKIKAQQIYECKQERFDSDSVDNRNMSSNLMMRLCSILIIFSKTPIFPYPYSRGRVVQRDCTVNMKHI